MNSNDLERAKTLVNGLNPNVKRIKKETGLIERESLDNSKIILAEDNRQILLG